LTESKSTWRKVLRRIRNSSSPDQEKQELNTRLDAVEHRVGSVERDVALLRAEAKVRRRP